MRVATHVEGFRLPSIRIERSRRNHVIRETITAQDSPDAALAAARGADGGGDPC